MQAGQTPGATTASSDEHTRLKAEHHELDAKLTRLEGLRHLTPEEEVEVKALKKQKLALKDKMSQLAKG
ncbi:MAG: YdcH family protein [Nitrospinota bacterium]